MPELPEVETIRRGLIEFIIHDSIEGVDVLCEKSFIGDPCTARGYVTAIRRFGKALVIDLDTDYSIIIHLRMTGQLIYDGETRYAAGHPSDNFTATLPNRQTRVVFKLRRGTLYFNDQRKFGFVHPVPTSSVMDDPFISKLAPEPWTMPPELFYESLMRHRNSCIMPPPSWTAQSPLVAPLCEPTSRLTAPAATISNNSPKSFTAKANLVYAVALKSSKSRLPAVVLTSVQNVRPSMEARSVIPAKRSPDD